LKTTSRSRSLTRSIMSLFGTKKQLSTYQRHPDEYYKLIWFDKKMFDGIAWVARFERVSKKKAARLLIERGFSSWLGEKIKEDLALRELESKPHLTRFILSFRKFAREHGMDISKFKF
jgi:hypothetical protein